MEKYLGVKLLEAKPLNLGDYNLYRGWIIPENEDPKKEGYLVIYEDGYESWSPKGIFEKAYRKAQEWRDKIKFDGEGQEFKTRVVIKAEELQNKVDKLNSFINSNDNSVYNKLPSDEKERLQQQLLAMQYYLTILVERINKF